MFLLHLTSAIMFLIGGFGIFGNLNLIWATYRTLPSNRKASCGHLIGSLAFLDLICIVFEWENALRLLLGIENHRRTCFWAISPYLYAINFQASLILVIALDRVCAMLYPMKYKQKACNPPLGYPPLVSMIWNRWILTVDSTTIVLYIVALLALTQNDKIERRVLVLDPTREDNEDSQRGRGGVCVFLVFLPLLGSLCYNDRPQRQCGAHYPDRGEQFKALIHLDLKYCQRSANVTTVSMSSIGNNTKNFSTQRV
ncbi:hypothetical protein L596_025926 [Steinernema carpocapsae]|uniref:G-protein coupled receptors family 1 profile domain-containing protein n=1 Tax=Steinernema carpocapsae TaxID=34508 RepID=A0A4V5ZZA1_STECR|nr:hypothetical protein L596_025926 [Steinernema carpocapsae]